MTACRVRASGAPPPTSSPDCIAETTYQAGALATELSISRGPARELRRLAATVLETGRALLEGMAEGPGRTALADGLSVLDAALTRRVREDAIASVPTSSAPSPTAALTRSLDRAARARVPRGSTHGFVQAVAGNMTMAHLRTLGTLDRAQVRERLARVQSETVGESFLNDAEIDGAMAQIEGRLAQRFENAVRERAVNGLQLSARRFERMAGDPGGAEVGQLSNWVREGRADHLLEQLERVGADVRLLRQVNELAKGGANVSANVEERMVEALGVAAARLRERASEVAGWREAGAMQATRTFGDMAERVATRMALGGIVQSAVDTQVAAAEEREERVDTTLAVAWFAANVVLGIATMGSSLTISMGTSAGLRLAEAAVDAREARQRADRDAVANLAGLAGDEQAARSSCEAGAAESPMAMVVGVAAGTVLGRQAGELVEPVAGGLAGAVVDATSGVDFEPGCEAR